MKRFIFGLAILSLVIFGANYATTQAKELSIQAFSQNGNLPRNGVRIPMLELTLTAGDEAVTIRELTLSRTGLSSSDDIGSVWIQNGFSRLTRRREFNNDDILTLPFVQDLVIPAYGTTELTVLANLEFDNGGQTLAINLVSLNTDARLVQPGTLPTAKPTVTTVTKTPTKSTNTQQRRASYDRSLYRVQCRNSRCQLVKR